MFFKDFTTDGLNFDHLKPVEEELEKIEHEGNFT